MNLRLETIRPQDLKHLPMSQHMRTFLKRRTTLRQATHVVVAYSAVSAYLGEPVRTIGVLLYHWAFRVLTDQGIYVEKQFRGDGVGTAMYQRAHADKKTRRRTDVTALTREGAKFISKMSAVLPSVHLTEYY